MMLTAWGLVEAWFLDLEPLLQVPLVLLMWGLGAFLVERVLVAFLRAFARRTASELDDVAIDTLDPALAIVLFAGGAWWSLRRLPSAGSGGFVGVLDGALLLLVLVAAAIALIRLSRGLLGLAARRKPRYSMAARLGGRGVAITVWIVAGLVLLDQYGLEITPLLTTLGIAGLAVALALQDTLANFFAGIWIQAGRSVSPGHYVRLEEQKVEGFVDEVGWRTTRIRTLPGNYVEVPNQTVARNTITDYWLPTPKMGTDLTLVTGFEADPERVVAILVEEALEASREVAFVLERPSPQARLNRIVENGWEFWLSFWVPFYYVQGNAQGYVLNRIRKRFLREGIRLPYPIREQVVVPPDRPDLSGAATMPSNGEGRGGDGVPGAVAEGVLEADGRPRVRPVR